MKKFTVFVICFVLLSAKTNAFDYPWVPQAVSNAPILCPQCTQEQIGLLKSGADVAQKATTREGQKQLLGDAQAHLEKYAIANGKIFLNKLTGKFQKKKDDGKPISYTRMIKQTKTNLNDVEAVKESFKKYFLFVPSKNEEIQASYKEKREQFVEDTTLELYITAKEMDAELKVMLSQLELIQQCMIMGDIEKCKAQGMEEYNCQKDENTEDEMCYRRNALLVADIYDTIVKYNEYLIAMRAQYEAVRTLGQGVKPKEYSDKNKKTSSLQRISLISTAFAAQEVEKESLVLDELPASKFEFKDNNKIGVPTPFEGKENNLIAPSIFYEAQKHISAATESHDLKQMLPDFKKAFDSYHDVENMHKKYVEELQSSQECVLNYLSQRYTSSQKVWLDNCSVEDDGYVCAYKPARSVANKSESEGIYDVICPNSRSNKCYKLAPTAYNEIGGMSGWLINMYLNAKDKLSSSDTNLDDYVIYSSDIKPEADENSSIANNVKSVENLKTLVEDNKVLVDKYIEDIRTLSQLSFSIGSAANNEIGKDVNGTSKFNVSTKAFPLWNDQKNFYNQDIDGKYENIITYLKEAPFYKSILTTGLEINKTYDYKNLLAKEAESVRKEVATQITSLLELPDIDIDTRIEKIELILAQEDAKLNELSTQYKQQLQELEQQRVNLYEQLQNINLKEAELYVEVEKQNSVINYAENYNEAAEMGAKMDPQYQTEGNPHKTNEEMFNEKIKEQAGKELSAEEARSNTKQELSRLIASKKDITDKITNIELQIKKLGSEFVLTYYNAEQKYKQDLEKIKSDDLDKALNAAQKNILSVIKATTVLGEAERMTELLREYAIKKVTEAKSKIDALKTNNKNSLYYAENNATVVEIHGNMLKQITKIDINDVVSELGLDEVTATTMRKYSEALSANFADICDKVSCYQPDNDYFVGLVEQKRDFSAPKAAIAFSSAPMREIFHFAPEDISFIDYYAALNFVIDADNKVAAENQKESIPLETAGAKILLIENSLLDSGINLPEIWKIALSRRPFVEKELDLNKFLNPSGTEGVALVRSGIYPCMVGSKIVDVLPNAEGDVFYTELSWVPLGYDSQKLPQCRAIKATEDGYIDAQADTSANKIQLIEGKSVSTLEASELGNILDYAEININRLDANGLSVTDIFGTTLQQKKMQYLTFRKEFLAALRHIENYMNNFDSDENTGFSSEYYLYNRIFPTTNQLGDYLIKVDMERISLEARENVKNQLYSQNLDDTVIVNNLYKSFAKLGFDFDRQKFDLSQTSYYQQAENVLNAHKAENLRLAKEILQDQRLTNLSEEMEKRKENLLHQIALLELDSDETVQTNSEETLEELAERIKTEQADRAVQNKKIEKANRFMQERLVQSDVPYCAVYAQ